MTFAPPRPDPPSARGSQEQAASGPTELFDFATTGPERASPGARPSRRREPALDGLRGLAVTAVVLYHAGVGAATGGYLGVDAFFVLSGYLITGGLLEEWDRRGRIDLVRFWQRRLRRLVPPLVVLVAGVAALCLVLDPASLGSVRGDGLATLAYVMNWRLIAESSSYFDQFTVSPLTHAWSLAIEEQFYLLWPPIVLGVLAVARSARAVLVVSVALATASAVWMVLAHEPGTDPSRLYFGTDTRAQALLIGAALAAAVATGARLAPGVARRRAVRAAYLAGAVLAVAWMRLPGTSDVLYRGGFTVLAVLVAVVVLAGTGAGANPVRRALSVAPLRALGLISYGIYLFHHPVFLWLNAPRTGLAAGSAGLLILRLGVTVTVATASYLLLERPILRGSLDRGPIGPALRPALGPAAVVASLALLGAATTRATPRLAELRSGPPASAAAAGDSSRVLLVGDSVAFTLGRGLVGPVAAGQGLTVWNRAVLFCELQPHARYEGGVERPASGTCSGWEDQWRREVAVVQPDLTVLQVGAWEIFDRLVEGELVAFGSPAGDRLLDGTLDRAVGALASGGAMVAVVTTPPLLRDDGTNSREWTQNDARRTDHFNARLRALADRHPDTVRVVDLAGHLCPSNQCRAEIDGAGVRPDGLHFGPADAPVVARWLAARLRDLVVPGPPAAG